MRVPISFALVGAVRVAAFPRLPPVHAADVLPAGIRDEHLAVVPETRDELWQLAQGVILVADAPPLGEHQPHVVLVGIPVEHEREGLGLVVGNEIRPLCLEELLRCAEPRGLPWVDIQEHGPAFLVLRPPDPPQRYLGFELVRCCRSGHLSLLSVGKIAFQIYTILLSSCQLEGNRHLQTQNTAIRQMKAPTALNTYLMQ